MFRTRSSRLVRLLSLLLLFLALGAASALLRVRSTSAAPPSGNPRGATAAAEAETRLRPLASTLRRRTLRAPGVAFPDGWRWDLRSQPYTVRMQVTNHSDVARTLCFSSSRQAGLSGNVNNVTTGNPQVPACQSLAAGEVRMLSVSYTTANSTLDGDAILAWIRAFDQADTSLATDASFKITVATAVSAPAAESLPEGQAYTRTFRI